MKKTLIYLLSLIFLIYIGISFTFYIKPELFIYHPNPIHPNIESAQKQIPDLKEVKYQTIAGQEVYAWYAKPANATKTVLFMHGNSYNIGAFINRIKPFYHAGYAVIMPEYTGFGGRSGTPTQTQIEQDIAATISFLNQQNIQNKDIILYGYSLGTYLAVYAASDLNNGHPFNAVILESPFTSLANTASWSVYHLFPIHFLLKDHYNSLAKIQKINTRLFIGHGTNDRTVPYFMGEKLFNTANHPKTFFRVIGGTHQNLPEYGFLNQVLEWLK